MKKNFRFKPTQALRRRWKGYRLREPQDDQAKYVARVEEQFADEGRGLADFDVTVDGVTHPCHFSHWRPGPVIRQPDGTVTHAVMNLYFEPDVVVPGVKRMFGPFVFAHILGEVHLADEVRPVGRLAMKQVTDHMARHMGLAYQETSLVRIGGDTDYADRIVYK